MRDTESRLASLEKDAMIQHAVNLALVQLLTMLWRDFLRESPEIGPARVRMHLDVLKDLEIPISIPSHAHPVQADFVSAHVKETMEGVLKRLLNDRAS